MLSFGPLGFDCLKKSEVILTKEANKPLNRRKIRPEYVENKEAREANSLNNPDYEDY